jgi:hypothetical protein
VNKGKILLYLVLHLLVFIGCEKRVVVISEACMTSNTNIANKGDTITFINCSLDEYVTIQFPRTGEQPKIIGSYSFDSNNVMKKVFLDTGDFTAVQTAMSLTHMSVFDTAMIYIRINQ